MIRWLKQTRIFHFEKWTFFSFQKSQQVFLILIRKSLLFVTPDLVLPFTNPSAKNAALPLFMSISCCFFFCRSSLSRSAFSLASLALLVFSSNSLLLLFSFNASCIRWKQCECLSSKETPNNPVYTDPVFTGNERKKNRDLTQHLEHPQKSWREHNTAHYLYTWALLIRTMETEIALHLWWRKNNNLFQQQRVCILPY